MKKLTAILLALALTFSLAACGKGTASSASDDAVTEAIIANFTELTKIPRGTFNEKQVSDYLLAWGKSKGFETTQDAQNNIVIEVPATAGFEAKPLIVLQAHMDMVVIADDGYAYDPLTDPIKIVRENGKLTAEHTSLGADDGIGIAIIQYIIENNKSHGPMRVIITTDEEVSSTGIAGLDPENYIGAPYLINVDCENSSEIYVSSASGVDVFSDRSVTSVKPSGNACYTISISGGAGGHSGININSGKLNTNVAVCDLLYQLTEKGINYEVASVKGGKNKNSIPTSTDAVIVADSALKGEIDKAVAEFDSRMKSTYFVSDPDLTCSVTENPAIPTAVMSAADAKAMICYMQNAVSGVYSISQKVENLTESSSNLGLIDANAEKISIKAYSRSCEQFSEDHIVNSQVTLGEALGFTVSVNKTAFAWAYKEDNELSDIAVKVYKEQNGSDPTLSCVHGGLETGGFSYVDPDIDIISIGPDITDAHSTNECVDIASILKINKLIEGIMAEIYAK